MKPVYNKVILRFKRSDIDATQKKGSLFMATHLSPNEHSCSLAYIEESGAALSAIGFKKGDFVLVQYLVQFDDAYYKRQEVNPRKNKYWLRDDDNGDEIRWCDVSQVYCKKDGDKLIPVQGVAIGELPTEVVTLKSEYLHLLPQQQNSKISFYTKLRGIHPLDGEALGLQGNETVQCGGNADVEKNFFGEKLLWIPVSRILAIRTNDVS